MTAADVHEIAAARLRGSAQRYTRSRRALVETLARSASPLTMQQILDADTELAQSSAYRNLAVLEDAEVVHRIVTSDDFARYELAEDLTEHHHHLICSTCGEVEDFTLPSRVETSLERALGVAADANRFTIDHHRLDLLGRCQRCA